MSEELWRWSATETAEAIRVGAVSAVEVVTAALARLEKTNPVSNAFGEIAEDALDRAKEADAAITRGDAVGPLHGVPTAIKLNTEVEGLPTPDGVAEYRKYPAAETAPVVRNLAAAGAISIGRTNCPPFSTMWSTHSEPFGITRNPWDPAVTPGGSSGGAAVALATGVVSIAHGNDLGGSIRYPAAVCGVVGLRPTYGRVPIWHAAPGRGMPLCVQQFAVEGPLGRTVADVRLGLRAMEGADPRDPMAVPLPPAHPSEGPIRIAIVVDPGEQPLAGPGSSETTDAVRTAGSWLAEVGYEVEEVALPALGAAATLWWQLALTDFKVGGMVGEVHRVGDSTIRAWYDHMYSVYDDVFGEVTLADFADGYARRSLIRRQVSEFMDRYQVLLLPASGGPAYALDGELESTSRVAELLRQQWPNTAIPVLGLPGLGLPVISTQGAPLGVQLAGRAFDEETLLRVGEVLEGRANIAIPIDPKPL
ncbi:amidase [Nocardia sp. NPDC050630]|uniref:amidase n=1 Tax=Nocardia sp. NPDC050630 TaxID=3364321 RepID=UPI003789E82A